VTADESARYPMYKVTIVQVIHNSRRFIEPVFSAIFNQGFKDFNAVAVIAGNDDKGKELLMEKFPQVEIIDPGFNIGFAAGHNLVFDKYQPDFFQLVNPDLIMEPNYIEELLKAFADERVGAVTGKLYQWRNPPSFQKRGLGGVLDSTGVAISKSGRARDRGQHEIDKGQYDKNFIVDAVSGAGCMYRRAALENIRMPQLSPKPLALSPKFEYFDEDFHSYWEDVDLSWRMANAGWICKYQPSAIAYHGRGAGSSQNGYADVLAFIRHHKKLPAGVRRLNYQNHILMYIKNSKWFYPQFFIRELAMFIYILFFEIGTLKAVPQMLKLLPKMWKKRQLIKQWTYQ
jgi:GT2 family glycosyltransferase